MEEPSPAPSKTQCIVAGLWLANAVILFGAAITWSLWSPVARAYLSAPTSTNTVVQDTPTLFTLAATSTPEPGHTPEPSQTFTPSATLTETITPLPFSEGPIEIGRSVKGRPLEVYRFGTGDTEYLIVAGMHGGDEHNTVELADELMSYIRDHPETIPKNASLYILRALNPDGLARAQNYLGRTNANGVDLNRNWDAGWQKDWNRDGCWTTTYVTGGKSAGSEPEVQALMAFILEHHFTGLINYHAAALGVFPGGLPSTDGSIQLAETIASVSPYKYPPIDTGCEYTGGMVDWTAAEGVPSVDLELTNHSDTDLEINLRILQAFLTWKSTP